MTSPLEPLERIAEICAYLPMALCIVGKALAESPDLTPDDLVRRLNDPQSRLEFLGPVKAALAVSYQLLEETVQRYWRCLAVFPGTFDLNAAAALWRENSDYSLWTLSALCKRNMVEFHRTERRYGLHDLARDFAYLQLGEQERKDAERCHTLHYLRVFATAGDKYEEAWDRLKHGQGTIKSDVGDAVLQLAKEWHNLQAAYASATENQGTDDVEAAKCLCAGNPTGKSALLSLWLSHGERMAWLNASLNASRAIRDRAAEQGYLLELGRTYTASGDSMKAFDLLHDALALVGESADDAARQAKVLLALASAERYLGDLDASLGRLCQARQLSEEIGDGSDLAAVLRVIGDIHRDRGAFYLAIEHYDAAIACADKHGLPLLAAAAATNLGGTYLMLPDLAKARECYEYALPVFRRIGDRRREGEALSGLARVYRETREYGLAQEYCDMAIHAYQEALDMRHDWQDRVGASNVMIAYAAVFREAGRLDEALVWAEKAVKEAEQAGCDQTLAGALFQRSRVLMGRTRYLEAAVDLTRAYDIWAASGVLHWQASTAHELGYLYQRCFEAEQDADCLPNSEKWYKEAADLWSKIGATRTFIEARQQLGRVLEWAGRSEEALCLFCANKELSEQTHDGPNEARALAAMSHLMYKQGRLNEAKKCAQQALVLFDKYGMQQDASNVRRSLRCEMGAGHDLERDANAG